MWMGTKNGLNKLNLASGKIDHYYVKDGLPNDNVYAIVEDEESICRLFERLLQAEDYQYRIVKSGEQAEKIFNDFIG